MAFYNVLQGDMPFFKQLADRFTISDNYHQPGMGGTGLDSILAGFGDDIWHTDGKGNPTAPPTNQIENPDPQAGTNNFYTQDGFSGGSYSACADTTQPGVGSVVSYLQSLKPNISPNCEATHFYLLNNYNPGFFGDGTVDTTDTFTIPPVPTHSIGDVLLAANVSFHWYGEGFDQYKANPNDPTNVYCNICNPFQYETSIMTNASARAEVLKDTRDFYSDIATGNLPAVSFVKPGALNDGHPTSSKFSLFEAFVRKILFELRAHPDMMRSTAVMITVVVAKGFRVFGSVRKTADAERLKAEFGPRYVPLLFDVTDARAVKEAASQVRAALAGETLAGLVNNAGVAVPGSLLELPVEEFRRQLDVNVLGVVIATQAFAASRYRSRPQWQSRPDRQYWLGQRAHRQSIYSALRCVKIRARRLVGQSAS